MARVVGALCWVPFFSVGLVVSMGVLVVSSDRSLRVQAVQSLLLSALALAALVVAGVVGGGLWIVAFVGAGVASELSHNASKVLELVSLASPVLAGGAFSLFFLAILLGRAYAVLAALAGGDPRLPWVGARADRWVAR